MIVEYYSFLSLLANLVSEPIRSLAEDLNLPLVAALLLGLIGATSPCQLTTNLSALAYVSRQTDQPRTVVSSTLAYVLGKALVYTLVGLLVIGLGLELQRQSIPVVVVARKVLGPLMIVIGLVLLGLLRPRFSVGTRLSTWLQKWGARRGPLGAFVLGVSFSFAFCPTLFLLFFGLLVPLALRSTGGVVFPAVFALGTALPLIGLALALSLGATSLQGKLGLARQFGRYANLVAGAVFVLAGLNDTLIYWLL